MVRQCLNDIAIADLIGVAVRGNSFEFRFQLFQSVDLFTHRHELLCCDPIGFCTRLFGMLAEIDQLSDRLDGQAQFTRMSDEG